MEAYFNFDALKNVPSEIERIALSLKDTVKALKTKIPHEDEVRDLVEKVTNINKK